MTVSSELLFAILSMDAYNRGRGYGEGISGLSVAKDTQIGPVKIKTRIRDVSDTFEGEAQAAGFCAISNDAYYFRWFWSY